MEYLLVILLGGEDGGRTVMLDGQPDGRTSEVIAIGEGKYTVSLDQPGDFQPPCQPVTLTGTTPRQPMVVYFEPL